MTSESKKVLNLAGEEGSTHVALRHQAVRLFRRDRSHWQFRLCTLACVQGEAEMDVDCTDQVIDDLAT